MAELSDVVRDGSFDTISHDIVVLDNSLTVTGTIEVVVLDTGKLGGQDDQSLLVIRTRDNVAVISTHRPGSES